MKKLVLFLFYFFVSILVFAQSANNLQFIYIDHEVTTPVNKLCQQLKALRDDAKETGDVLIIYLSTGLAQDKYGLLSLTNTKNPNSEDDNTDAAFDNIIAALQNTNYHSVDPKQDVYNILKIFDWCNFVDESRKLKFASVTLDFYVSANYWLLGYQHSVISHLYTDLNVPSFSKGTFSFNVFKPKDVDLKYKEGKPFGENNLQDINNNIRIKVIN